MCEELVSSKGSDASTYFWDDVESYTYAGCAIGGGESLHVFEGRG